MWADHDVADIVETAKGVRHPSVGEIHLDHVTLTHAEPDGRMLLVTLDSPRPGVSTERAEKLFRPRSGRRSTPR